MRAPVQLPIVILFALLFGASGSVCAQPIANTKEAQQPRVHRRVHLYNTRPEKMMNLDEQFRAVSPNRADGARSPELQSALDERSLLKSGPGLDGPRQVLEAVLPPPKRSSEEEQEAEENASWLTHDDLIDEEDLFAETVDSGMEEQTEAEEEDEESSSLEWDRLAEQMAEKELEEEQDRDEERAERDEDSEDMDEDGFFASEVSKDSDGTTSLVVGADEQKVEPLISSLVTDVIANDTNLEEWGRDLSEEEGVAIEAGQLSQTKASMNAIMEKWKRNQGQDLSSPTLKRERPVLTRSWEPVPFDSIAREPVSLDPPDRFVSPDVVTSSEFSSSFKPQSAFRVPDRDSGVFTNRRGSDLNGNNGMLEFESSNPAVIPASRFHRDENRIRSGMTLDGF